MSDPTDQTQRRRELFAQYQSICALSGIEFTDLDKQALEPLLTGEVDIETFIAQTKKQFAPQ